MQARKTAAELMALADEDDKLAIVYLEVGKRLTREENEKESKMNLRKIITGASMLVLLSFLLMGSLTLAQDAPLVTNTPLVAATAEVTPEPVVTPAPVDTSRDLSVLIEALKEFALIVAVIVLAFKTAGLITPEVMDKALARGFELAAGLAAGTPNTLDDSVVKIAKELVPRLIADELAKRQTINYTVQPPFSSADTSGTVTATQPIAPTINSIVG